MNNDVKVFRKKLGQNIAEVRQRTGMSQRDFAVRLAMSRPSLANIETGRQSPRVETLAIISAMTGVPIAKMVPEVSIKVDVTWKVEE